MVLQVAATVLRYKEVRHARFERNQGWTLSLSKETHCSLVILPPGLGILLLDVAPPRPEAHQQKRLQGADPVGGPCTSQCRTFQACL